MDARNVLLNYTPRQIHGLPNDVIKTLATTVGIKYNANSDSTVLALIRSRKSYKSKIANDKYKANKLAKIKAAKAEAKAANIIKRTIKRSLVKPFRFVSMRLVDQIKFYARYRFTYARVKDLYGFFKSIKNGIKRIVIQKRVYPTGVILFFIPIGGAQVLARHITISALKSFNTFMTYYNNLTTAGAIYLKSGEGIAQSEAIDVEKFYLDMEHFELNKAGVYGNGKSCKMIYKTIGIEETVIEGKKLGDCAKQCLKYCGHDYEGEIYKIRDIRDLEQYIIDNNLPISIILNLFSLKRDLIDIIRNDTMTKIGITHKKTKFEKILNCYKLDINRDINLDKFYVHRSQEEKHIIIYDVQAKHYDIIDKQINLIDDLYISECSNLIHENEIFLSVNSINEKNTVDKVQVYDKYLFFDYETVIDFNQNSCMQEYSLSILVLDEEQLLSLNKADKENNMDEVNKIRKKCCITFMGFDCTEQFIKFLIKKQGDTAFHFIGYNNCNFDNFILLDGLLRSQQTKISVKDIFYVNNMLFDFCVNGRHKMFDLKKHLDGSLKSNCDNFKVNCCSKKEMDHYKMQLRYENGEIINYIHNNSLLREYNEFDVLATAVIYQRYRESLLNIPEMKQYAIKLHEHKTIGGLAWKAFEDHNKKTKFGKISYAFYIAIRKYRIAGRVELFNGRIEKFGRRCSLDVCSLYPFVMGILNCYYPCGDCIEVDEFYEGKLGFYWCDIDQSGLDAKNLPMIYPKKIFKVNKNGVESDEAIENDWNHNEILTNYFISTSDIELLQKFGCKVTIKNGIIFTDKMKSCDMFGFLLNLMKGKNEQDFLKAMKDPKYNSALRSALKLIMNAISGKLNEGLHIDKTEAIDNVQQFLKIEAKAEKDKVKNVNVINAVGDKVFISYEVNAEDICDSKQRPIYVGAFIYSYARRYMYEYLISKIGKKDLGYTDTDSGNVSYSAFEKWFEVIKKENITVPHWKEIEKYDDRYKTHLIYQDGSKVFGSFEDELKDFAKIPDPDSKKPIPVKFYYNVVRKKSYVYSSLDKDGQQIECKFKFAGIRDDDVILNLNEDFVMKINDKYFINEDKLSRVNQFYNESNNDIKGQEMEFMGRLVKEGKMYVLCKCFKKIVKNTQRQVGIDDDERYNTMNNKIVCQYMIKEITA